MENKFYIASRLAKIKMDEAEKSRITLFFSKIAENQKEQEDFFQYCKTWKLAPWIFIQMSKHGLIDKLNPKIQLDFKTVYEKVRSENENRNKTAVQFLKEFEREGIEVAILKGNLFLHKVYQEIGYKKMNDFDMLIHLDDWPKVQEIYFKLAYIPLGFGWGGEKGKAAKYSHAGLSFISPDFKCITGTQWGLKSPTSKYSVQADDIWQNTKEFEFEGLKIKQLSTEYNLLHLILHMGIYKCGIRDCMDIYNLLLTAESFDEDKFVALCEKSNAMDKAFFTLQLTNVCSGTVSESLIEKLRSNKNNFINRRLNARLKMAERSGDMQLSYNDYFHEVEMTVFYFSIFPQFHKKLFLYFRLVKLMFWPDAKLLQKIADYESNPNLSEWLKIRIKAPYYTFSLIGEEIGVKITLLLFVKMFFDSLISIKNYLLKKDSYFEYLKKRGLNADDIKRAVKEIQ